MLVRSFHARHSTTANSYAMATQGNWNNKHGDADDGQSEVPGTVHLVDLEGTMHTKHAKGEKSDIVLIPAPSSDPDDPVRAFPPAKMSHHN